MRIPDLQAAVEAAGGEAYAVGAERHPPNGLLVAAEAAHLLPGVGVPEGDEALHVGGRDPLAVRADRDTDNHVVVAQRGQGLALQAFQVAPLPAAQVLRALLQQLDGPAEVARGPLALRQ